MDRDIIVTLLGYSSRAEALKDIVASRKGEWMRIEVPATPKQSQVNGRCFLVWDNHLLGFLNIKDIVNTDEEQAVYIGGKLKGCNKMEYPNFTGYKYFDYQLYYDTYYNL